MPRRISSRRGRRDRPAAPISLSSRVLLLVVASASLLLLSAPLHPRRRFVAAAAADATDHDDETWQTSSQREATAPTRNDDGGMTEDPSSSVAGPNSETVHDETDETERELEGSTMDPTSRSSSSSSSSSMDDLGGEESLYDPFARDASCDDDGGGGEGDDDDECWHPPESTLEYGDVVETTVEDVVGDAEGGGGGEGLCGVDAADDDDVLDCTIEEVCADDDGGGGGGGGEEEEEEARGSSEAIDATASYGGDDPDGEDDGADRGGGVGAGGGCRRKKRRKITRRRRRVDKHWGSDEGVLRLREALRAAGQIGGGAGYHRRPRNGGPRPGPGRTRPPVFLLPGLASTRLVAWTHKACPTRLSRDIKVQDYVWMNMGKIIELAGAMDAGCWIDCMTLGPNQTDNVEKGCKIRPDEGLDAISSLAPGSVASSVLVGGTNTVYAWLTQWLADNLGYDVTSIVGLPYDWRLSPDVMEGRDGFLTLMRKRIEAAVAINGAPGIMVAHSMGNSVFRYFLEWLRVQFKEEAYDRYVHTRHMHSAPQSPRHQSPGWIGGLPNYIHSVKSGIDDLWRYVTDDQEHGAPAGGEPFAGRSRDSTDAADDPRERSLWGLAEIEGDAAWLRWLERHIWTYVGLSAPLIGALGPLRAVLSGETMGLPITDAVARGLELSFGSTHTANLISTKMGFCDNDEDITNSSPGDNSKVKLNRAKLACLDELVKGIEQNGGDDPWRDFDALRLFLKERVDWDTAFPPVAIVTERCTQLEKPPCDENTTTPFGAMDVQSGEIFTKFNEIWREENTPLLVKRDQLKESWWSAPFPNLLNSTWDRPPIKHVIMAYGVDVPTEAGYVYKKVERVDNDAGTKGHEASDSKRQKGERIAEDEYDGMPVLQNAIWEEADGKLVLETLFPSRGTITESVLKKRIRKEPLDRGNGQGKLHHSGDGTIPYLSLSWAHTWLLHATRAMRHSEENTANDDHFLNDNALEAIKFSFRPKGGSEWVSGKAKSKSKGGEPQDATADGDTGTSHPHGTKYKPEMRRFQSEGRSRTTGMRYTTAVIEAIGVEHKETTRNYDILAAAFTDILRYMHDDLGLV